MARLRLTIAGLIAAVALIGGAFTLLRQPWYIWDDVVYLLTFTTILTAVLVVVLRRGAVRALTLGFALFGGIYFLLDQFQSTRERLPTTQLIYRASLKMERAYLIRDVERLLNTPDGNSGTDGVDSSGIRSILARRPDGSVVQTQYLLRHAQSILRCGAALLCGLIGGVASLLIRRDELLHSEHDSSRRTPLLEA